MPGKLLLTWAITLKCLDRTSYCLEHICIHSQCKSPWKALCRSPAFWAFPVVPVFQSKPIGDEFWACLGMWIPSYIPGFMSLTVNMSLSFHHCFCREQLQLHVPLPLALQPWPQGHGTDLRQDCAFDPKDCQAVPDLTSCQQTATEMQELWGLNSLLPQPCEISAPWNSNGAGSKLKSPSPGRCTEPCCAVKAVSP